MVADFGDGRGAACSEGFLEFFHIYISFFLHTYMHASLRMDYDDKCSSRGIAQVVIRLEMAQINNRIK